MQFGITCITINSPLTQYSLNGMKNIPSLLRFSLLAAFIILISSSSGASEQKNSYDELWKNANKAAEKGLPKTAIEVLDIIRAKALQEHNDIELIRANIFHYSLMQSFEEDYLIKAIAHANTQLAVLSRPGKELMHSLLAEMYWFYYQQNRYEILERTNLLTQNSDDIREWDRATLRNIITEHYDRSLLASTVMDTVPLIRYASLLTSTQKEALTIQPTLFDFVAARALDYYSSMDAGLEVVESEKMIQSPDFWKPVIEFTTLSLPQGESQHLLEINLLQKILLSNLKQGHTDALISNEIKRFTFLKSNYKGPGNADTLYINALKTLQETFASHPGSTEVAAARASSILSSVKDQMPDYPAALAICDDAIAKFPQSRGAIQCQQLRDQILAKELSVEIQRAVVPDQPVPVRLSYRNVTQPAFKLIRITSEQLEEIMQQMNQQEQINAFLALKHFQQKTIELPFETDYERHSTIVDLPALPTGLYVLLVADTPAFRPEGIIAFTSFQVSQLSFISHKLNNINTFHLLNRSTGKAISDATVRIMTRDYDYSAQKYVVKEKAQLTTAKDGSFSVGPDAYDIQNQAFYVEVFMQDDTLYSDNYFDVYVRKNTGREQNRTWFFTDRAIYRPGQVVYFKGITLQRKDLEAWEIQKSSPTTVRFYDVNNRETASLALQTNAYGSFEGSFMIPQNLLNGVMRIGNESGSTTFSVEEYKRPTFEVKLEAEDQQFRLNEPVTLKGSAAAFAGYALDSVSYSYYVEREQFLPFRPYWFYYRPIANEKIMITQGQSLTKKDGSFSITFNAETPPNEDLKYQPVYSYTVVVDVTDRNGETRRGTTTVNVSNRALLLETTLDNTIEAGKTKGYLFTAKNLQQKAVDATVKVSFYLISPDKRITRKLPWEAVDRHYLSKEKLTELFPLDDFDSPKNPAEREKTLVWSEEKFVSGSAALFPETTAGWAEGEYLAELTAVDAFGQKVTHEQPFTLFKTKSKKPPVYELSWFHISQTTAQPGDTLYFYAGSAEKSNRVLIEISSGEQLLYHRWHLVSNSRKTIPFVVKEEHRGQLRFEAVFVRHNSLQQATFDVEVPFSNKQLDIRLETKRDNLLPGAEETWTLLVKDYKGKGKTTEVLAAMYDASLDVFRPHSWSFDLITRQRSAYPWGADNGFLAYTTSLLTSYPYKDYSLDPIQLPLINWYGLQPNFYRGAVNGMPMIQKAGHAMHDAVVEMSDVIANEHDEEVVVQETTVPSYLRDDFRETAFFYPQLTTDPTGLLRFTFKLPDALTRWNLMLLAHSDQLESGIKQLEFTASKELMVVPNLPRFFRQGDTTWISVKIVNTGKSILNGIANIEITDAITSKKLPLNQPAEKKPFLNLQPGQSQVIKWNVLINEESSLLAVTISATSGTFGDSEANYIPVLPVGVMVQESLPMHINGNSTKSFVFKGLKENRAAEKNVQLHLEFADNSAWYAIQALPYLSEKGSENSDNLFYRLYANSLASWVAQSLPGAMRVIESWKNQGGEALLSNLEKNESLKAVLLAETPWIFDATDENRQKQQIALLFDMNRMRYEQEQAYQKLAQQQVPDGSWAWFPGMPGSVYITQQIVTGFGKLKKITGSKELEKQFGTSVSKAIRFLDQQAVTEYKKMLDRKETDTYILSSNHLNYLYARSFYGNVPASDETNTVMSFYLQHTASDWQKLSLHQQAKAALVLKRGGKDKEAKEILASLKETAIVNPDLGTYWSREKSFGYSHSFIETQGLLIEAFDEIAGDTVWIDGLRQWLLTQKQTTKWETTRATAEAVYALLLKGNDWISDIKPLEIKVGGAVIDATNAEAGTGRITRDWFGTEIDSTLAVIEVTNPNKVMAWGGVYRQYSVPMDQVKSNQTNLTIRRELYVEKSSPKGLILIPVSEAEIHIGDRVKVRIVLEADRDMEYLHLKDYRAAAFEPAETISAYRYEFGMGYYQSTRDASTDFFFNYLPKGKYVFEYALTATQSGNFTHGYSLIQSFYAPEFSSHSDGIRVEVRE